jgi:two-component system sensor histidine kinase RegB
MPAAVRDAGANRRNLGRLCLLRSLLIVTLVATAGLLEWLQGESLYRDAGLQLAIVLFSLFNLYTFWRLRHGARVGEPELLLQLVVDVLLVTLVLYRTGGSTNPFVSYYLVPLTLAAATLRPVFTASLAALTLAAYSLLLFHYIPFAPFGAPHAAPALELVAMEGHQHHVMPAPVATAGLVGFNLHILGMWLNFLLSAGLITFFVTRMSSALREQDRMLAEQHERLLQREQVVALGAMAAGAAHELGTPLATMSIIASEIEAGLAADSPLREEAALLRQQLRQCRTILQGLRAQAAPESPRVLLSALVRDAVARIEILYPQRQVSLALEVADRTVQAPVTLPQVLVNLLDNAAQAARKCIAVRLREEGDDCLIEISDDGPGVAPEIAARLGQPFVSGREEGLGIGYFLSHASVNQWGGSIHLQRSTEGGMLVRLRLPWRILASLSPVPQEPA